MKKLKIGYSEFRRVIEEDGYFVDKTMFIQEFIDNAHQVLLLPRPRRFGKTMNLSMLYYFFSVDEKDTKKLFDEFLISKQIEFCEKYQQKFPVIYLSLKSVRAKNWEGCLDDLKQVIGDLYSRHKYLLQSVKLDNFHKEYIISILSKKSTVADYKFSLRNLTEFLSKHYETNVIVLLDEYDTPIINGYTEGYYAEIIKFMQVFLGSTFKENPFLYRGVITGILRVARESIFSEMNNIGIFTINNIRFADKFGFTENETKELLRTFNLTDQYDKIKQWYNGYKFGNCEQIYNPWSIINYIDSNNEGFKPYWVNTGTDPLIKKRVIEPDIDKTRNTLQKLIAGETTEKYISENFVFADFETQKELLWTLLVYSGYLTIREEISLNKYKIAIPNYELRLVFKDVIISWFETDYKISRNTLEETAEHLINNRIPDFERGFKQIMGDTLSFFDISKNPEWVYQSYVLGLLAVIGDDYIIKSNRESGDGRYDIMLIPHDKNRYGIVIEIKQTDKQADNETDKEFATRINKKIDAAKRQIIKNKYYKELLEHKITQDKIIKLAIVFASKDVFITKLKNNTK